MNGQQLPLIKTSIPGPRSRALARELQNHECPNITLFSENSPIFWEKAAGSNVYDADGNRYVDFTAGFGVANAGHLNGKVVQAIRKISSRLIHHLGDVYPSKSKLTLMKELKKVFPRNLNTCFFGNSGSEAVEIALKTALLATGKPGIIVFEGAYHGLSYGALRATSMLNFRKPFASQLDKHTTVLPLPGQFPDFIPEEIVLEKIREKIKNQAVGAVLIEAVQGRGGIRIAPFSFMRKLRKICSENQTMMIVDEIFSGFARTGKWFAFEHSGVIPDLVTIGKGMSGGFPISACVGTREAMSHWPRHEGEALHSSTFMAHPMGCAMSLASIGEIRGKKLIQKARQKGKFLLSSLRDMAGRHRSVGHVRGEGLMIGLEIIDPQNQSPDSSKAHSITAECLKNGLILLSDGIHKNVLTLTPPLVIHEKLIRKGIGILEKCIAKAES